MSGGVRRCGAFSIARGADGEQAVLVMETIERDVARLDALTHDIRSRIGRALALPLADVVWVRRGRIPRTTSGKVQRGPLRQLYLRRDLGLTWGGALPRAGGPVDLALLPELAGRLADASP